MNPSESSRAIPGRSHWKLCLVIVEGDSPSSWGTRRLQDQPAGVENSLSSTKARTVTITQPHGSHSKQVATHREENMSYHRKKKENLNSILPRTQKKLVQMCLTSSGFRKIREKFTRWGQTHMKISQCWVAKGKLKTLQQNQRSPEAQKIIDRTTWNGTRRPPPWEPPLERTRMTRNVRKEYTVENSRHQQELRVTGSPQGVTKTTGKEMIVMGDGKELSEIKSGPCFAGRKGSLQRKTSGGGEDGTHKEITIARAKRFL